MSSFKRSSRSVFSDRSSLAFEYVPEQLVHRDNEMQRLFAIISPLLETGGRSAALVGGVGTGKTSLAKRFCTDFSEYAKERGKCVEFALVNCRQKASNPAVLLKILRYFDPHFPDRGFSLPEMLEILRNHIKNRGCHFIVVLDEADVLARRSGTDLIYNLSRFEEDSVGGRKNLSLILISQHLPAEFLDEAILSTVKRSNTIRFSPYTADELYDITMQRAGLALYPGAAEEEAVRLISEIAAERGDARFAIELLETAGMLADERGLDTIGVEEVRSAKAETYGLTTADRLADLEKHKLLVLLAISRIIRGRIHVTTGELEKEYGAVCEEYGEEKRGHTQFWKYLNDLEILGIMDRRISGKGQAGNTSLITIRDVAAEDLSEAVKSILNGKK